MRSVPRNTLHFQQGFTLLEAMISFVILALGLLGVAAMQANAKRSSYDAMQRAIAISVANDIVERMKINKTDAIAGNYNGSYDGASLTVPSVDCNSANCTDGELRTFDLYEWQKNLTGTFASSGMGLTDAVGCVSVVGGVQTVVISWQARTDATDSASAYDSNHLSQNCGSSGNRRRMIVMDSYLY